MEIERGLFDNAVLQRNADNVSQAEFSGTCSQSGTLKVYVSFNNKAVENLHPIQLGSVADGFFKGCITGIPAGGPYDIKITIEDSSNNIIESISIGGVLIGDVWILAGQSNMEGVGQLRYSIEPIPMVHAFYMNDIWDVAKDPIHVLADAVDPVHVDLFGGARPEKNTITGVGPGLSFAQEMYKITNIPQGIIACAHGGTSMTQWDPKGKELGGKSLYGAMYRRFVKNGSKVAGVLWYQGCNDANSQDVPLYTSRMKELICSIRKDFNNEELPFVAAQLSRVCYPPAMGKEWNCIREQQRLLPNEMKNVTVVPTIDLAMEDFIHISGYDQNRLGVRFAGAMLSLVQKSSDRKPPIILKDISVIRDEVTNLINVVVTFDNVVGELTAKGRPSGFELTGKTNEITAHYVFGTELKGNQVILSAGQNNLDTNNFFLYYGFGVQPYCNITDEADRSLPAFGPVRVGKAVAISGYALNPEISKIIPGADKLKLVEYPKDLEALEFSRIQYGYMRLDTHDRMVKAASIDGYLFYKLAFECEEDMNLKIYLGYDGPVKMWIDKENQFYDPNGTKPADVEDSKTAFHARKGKHEILIALASNNGQAGSIFLCLERTDVEPEQLSKGPGNYVVPQFI